MAYSYGRKADLPDQRDHLFSATRPVTTKIPAYYRAKNPSIEDQGQIGSCVGHGVTGAFRQLLLHEGMPDYVGSRLATYYCARDLEGNTAYDAGAEIRDGVKAISKFGVMPESMWPYIEANYAVRPSDAAYAVGAKHLAFQYKSVDNTNYDECCRAIYENGNLVIGLTVYESFESATVARNGKVPLPKLKEQQLGGHCMRAFGYTADNLIVANSWGTGWGDFGLCYIPKKYITNPGLASDFWTLVKA